MVFFSGNCGAHALCAIEWIVAKQKILTFADDMIPQIRMQIAVEIFANSMDPS
jgi:hypothetical protein